MIHTVSYKSDVLIFHYLLRVFVDGWQPALIPLLLVIETQLNPQRRRLKTGRTGGWTSLAITTWGSVLISLFEIWALTSGALPSLPGLVLSIIELMALFTVYGTLLPKPVAVSSATPFVDIETYITSLTPRVTGTLLIALAAQHILLGSVPFDLGAMLLGGAAKAITRFLAMEMVR